MAAKPKTARAVKRRFAHSKSEWDAAREHRMAEICGPDHRVGPNLYVSESGRTACRACNRAAQKKRREKSINFMTGAPA